MKVDGLNGSNSTITTPIMERLGAYSLFIRELNAMMDHIGINDIERLDPDLHWEADPLAYDVFNRNNM